MRAEYLEVDHAELSALAVGRWELAEPIQRAVRCHHDPDRAMAEAAPGKVSLSLVINRADAFVNYLGLSVLRPPPTRNRLRSIFLDFRTPRRARSRLLSENGRRSEIYSASLHI